jgi:hypothetical protein
MVQGILHLVPDRLLPPLAHPGGGVSFVIWYNPPMRTLLILLAVLIVAGCSSSSPTEPTETSAAQDRDQIQAETNQPVAAPTTRTSVATED